MEIVKDDIEPKNSKGDFHGYQEWYYNNRLWVRCNYDRDEPIGYEDDHHKYMANYYIR